MTFFKIFSSYFWAFAILTTYFNAAFFKRSAKDNIQQNPELAAGYSKFIRNYSFWMNVPWFVMGIGCIFDRLTFWHYLRPGDGNPFVIAWWILMPVLYVLSFYWIFFRKGAEKLAEYQIVRYSSSGRFGHISNSMKTKLGYLLCLAGGIVVAVAMLTKNIPLPPFLTE